MRWVTCALLIVVGAMAAWYAGHRAITAHLNSDLLYPFELYRDFFVERGRDLTHLSWTPASFIAPDLIVLWLLRAVVGDAGSALHAYAVFAWLSLVGAGYAVVSAAAPRRPALEVTLAAGALWLLCLIDADRTELVTLLPIYHHGSLMSGLLCLAILLRAARNGWTRRRELGFFLLLLLASLSDLVFVTQFLLPSLAALVLAARAAAVPWSVPRRAMIWMVAAGTVNLIVLRSISAFSGVRFRGNPIALHIEALTSWPALLALVAGLILWWARPMVVRHGVSVGLLLGLSGGAMADRLASAVAPPGWPLDHVQRFTEGLHQLAATDPQLWIALPAALLLALVSRHPRAPVAVRMLSTIFLVQTALLLIEGSLTFVGHGKQVFLHPDVFDEGTLRHLQPLYVLPPIVMGSLWLWQRQGAPPRWLMPGVLLLLSAKLAIATPPQSAQLPYPDEVRCLDEAGLRVGYGDYWTARYLTLLSHRGLVVDPVELHFMGVERWENNPAQYLSHVDPYQFIVVGRWRRERLVARFGEPARAVRCGELEALIYDRPSDFGFRNLLHLAALADNGRTLPPAPLGLDRPISDGTSVAGIPLVTQAALPTSASGPIVEVSISSDTRTTLSLLDQDGAELERMEVQPVSGQGMRRRWLRRATSAPIASVRLAPAAAVGHLFVYNE